MNAMSFLHQETQLQKCMRGASTASCFRRGCDPIKGVAPKSPTFISIFNSPISHWRLAISERYLSNPSTRFIRYPYCRGPVSHLKVGDSCHGLANITIINKHTLRTDGNTLEGFPVWIQQDSLWKSCRPKQFRDLTCCQPCISLFACLLACLLSWVVITVGLLLKAYYFGLVSHIKRCGEEDEVVVEEM